MQTVKENIEENIRKKLMLEFKKGSIEIEYEGHIYRVENTIKYFHSCIRFIIEDYAEFVKTSSKSKKSV